MFDKRPHSSRKDVIHDAIQVVCTVFFSVKSTFFGIYFSVKLSYNSFQANIADLYFKNSLNTRLSLVYVETWQDADQTPGFSRQRYNDIFLNVC